MCRKSLNQHLKIFKIVIFLVIIQSRCKVLKVKILLQLQKLISYLLEYQKKSIKFLIIIKKLHFKKLIPTFSVEHNMTQISRNNKNFIR